MADGTTKAIKDVKIGDEVLATDPESGKTKPEKVTAEIKGVGLKHLVQVTVDVDGKQGSKTASVTATDQHPFWVPELGEWLDATDLHASEWLSTGSGTRVQITAVKRWTASTATVHNLTVGELHTYYVVAGATPVLVHNCGIGRELIGDEDSTHILAGHRYPGAPGKDAFPQDWSDDQILDSVADVVTSPTSQRTWYKGSAVHAERTLKTRRGEPAVQNVIGTVRGVKILVRYEPLTGRVLTAFPQ